MRRVAVGARCFCLYTVAWVARRSCPSLSRNEGRGAEIAIPTQVWVGWLGADVPPAERPRVAERLMREHGCYPVFLDAQLVDRYYNGFCNDVLWPLFHYVPLPAYQAGAEKKFDARLWEAYKEANARFADAVLEVWSAGPPTENDSTATAKVPDYVWVHDYHLMRLPLSLIHI